MDLKYKLASAMGCSLEWFDFVLYGFFSPIIASTFFPAAAGTLTNIINTFGIFAVGFLARPLGGIVFGHISEHYGRTTTLKFTPITLSIFTASIGLIPPYAMIGNLAITLLFCFRFAQGICMGGESSSSIIYLVESSPKHSYFWGSIGSCAGGLGILLASMFSSIYFILLHNSNNAWLWRAAFIAALPIGILIYLARRNMQEHVPAPESLAQSTTVLLEKKKNIALTTGILCLHATSFYFVFMFIPNFLINFRQMNVASSMLNNTFFLVLQLCFIPIFGLLADKIGGKKIAVINTILFLILSVVLYHFITYATYNIIYVIMLLLCLLVSANAGVLPAIILKQLPTKGRSFIFSVSFNLAFAIFGGLVPYVCLSLVKHTSVSSLLPGYYLAASAVVTLISLGSFLFKKVSHGSHQDVKNTLSSY